MKGIVEIEGMSEQTTEQDDRLRLAKEAENDGDWPITSDDLLATAKGAYEKCKADVLAILEEGVDVADSYGIVGYNSVRTKVKALPK